MLSDYIREYVAARESCDATKMQQIERDLALLGMDPITLCMLANEEVITDGRDTEKRSC